MPRDVGTESFESLQQSFPTQSELVQIQIFQSSYMKKIPSTPSSTTHNSFQHEHIYIASG
jgi:hypothetical protein